MKTVYMTPEEICEYWRENSGDTTPRKIAENDRRAAEVFISSSGDELQFTVMRDGDVVAEYQAISEDEVDFILEEIDEEIDDITPEGVTATDDEVIGDREAELSMLLEDFIYSVTDGQECIEDTESALDKMCAFLYKEFGLSIYRPMILVDEDGVEERYDYPYDYLDLEEEAV